MDHCWRNILKFITFSGEPKYHVLCKLVKSVLLLHNGNSAVEQSLADSKNTCIKELDNFMP